MDAGKAISVCVNRLGLTALPDWIEVKYLDAIDFFNLKEHDIPEELTHKYPVLTTQNEDKTIIYVNFNALADNEYHTLEILLTHIVKCILAKREKYIELKNQMQKPFVSKTQRIGFSIFTEYQELNVVISVMYKLYNLVENDFQKKNPYTPKTNKSIAINVIERALKETDKSVKISMITYGVARMSINGDYDYSNAFNDKVVSDKLNKIAELLKTTTPENIGKKELIILENLMREL